MYDYTADARTALNKQINETLRASLGIGLQLIVADSYPTNSKVSYVLVFRKMPICGRKGHLAQIDD